MGHSSIKTTMRYMNSNLDEIRKKVEMLNWPDSRQMSCFLILRHSVILSPAYASIVAMAKFLFAAHPSDCKRYRVNNLRKLKKISGGNGMESLVDGFKRKMYLDVIPEAP